MWLKIQALSEESWNNLIYIGIQQIQLMNTKWYLYDPSLGVFQYMQSLGMTGYANLPSEKKKKNQKQERKKSNQPWTLVVAAGC